MQVKLVKNLKWLGHDSFRLDGARIIYFDPWQLPNGMPAADLVFISHEHSDHCSPADVIKIVAAHTVIVANPTAASKLKGGLKDHVRVLRPGDRTSIAGVPVQAVPAYNINKFRRPGLPFHPQSALHNGYIVTIDGENIYFAGDTDHIPEMAAIDCDLALLPVSGTYVMTAQEAAKAAQVIQPRVAAPMHYGAGVAGTVADAKQFAALYEGQVVIFDQTR